jgi:protein-disulfide isomerase
MTRKTFFIVLAVVLLVAAMAGSLFYLANQPPAPVANPEALARFHSPTLGDANAKVHIVEFLDPACETCRDFYPFVKNLMAQHPGRIRLTLRYAPFHKGSDQVVKLLEASRKQGKYWQTLEALLNAQPQWTIRHVARFDLALRAVEGVGLQMDALYQDMGSPEIAKLIQQDLQDAVTLKVSQTPEFFVNGRPMPSFGYDELRGLVEHALREAYR